MKCREYVTCTSRPILHYQHSSCAPLKATHSLSSTRSSGEEVETFETEAVEKGQHASPVRVQLLSVVQLGRGKLY